jgi:hypothetical protein
LHGGARDNEKLSITILQQMAQEIEGLAQVFLGDGFGFIRPE